MKSNVKRFIALITAAAMTTAPCFAYAATADEDTAIKGATTGTSDSIIEVNTSDAPKIGNVVLTTVNDDTFDFAIDPEDKLNQYRPNVYTNQGKGIYFEHVKTNSAIQWKVDTTAAITVVGKTAKEITDTEFTGVVTTSTNGSITISTAATAGALYVWVPDNSNGVVAGSGKYEQLTQSNIDTYFTADKNGVISFKSPIGAAATDKKVYINEAITLTGNYDPEDYVKIVNGKIDSILPGYIISTGSAVNVGDLHISAADLQLTEAETEWDNTSAVLKATNKSADDITVKATVTVDVKSGSGLQYLEESAIAASTAAAINFKIVDNTNTSTGAAISVSTGGSISGTYEFDMVAATGTAIEYITGEIDPNTNGDIFKQYIAPDPTYTVGGVYIEATATGATAMDAWKEYAKNVTAETRPTIKVVYTFEVSGGSASVDMGNGATGSLEGWGYNSANYWLNAAHYGITSIDTISVSVDGVTYYDLTASDYSFKDNGFVNILKASTKRVAGGVNTPYLKIVSNGTTYTAQLW